MPAMATDWKELMEDWISTLEMENRLPWNPAGRPTLRISFIARFSMRSARRFRCTRPSEWIRHRMTSTALMICEIMVASATPATSMWKTMTKNRFRNTFTSPEMERKYSGLRVSPTALSMAAPKL